MSWWFNSQKTTAVETPAQVLTMQKNTEELAKSFVNAEIREIQVIERADKVYSSVFSILEQGENDIQNIFDAAENGKLEEDLLDELTNELTTLKNMQAKIVSATDDVIKTADIVLKVETEIRRTMQKKLNSQQINKIKLIDESERKVLTDAKDMSKMSEKINNTVMEILNIDTDAYKVDLKNQARKLRRKKSAIDVCLLKLQSDIREIDAIKNDVLKLYNIGKELGIQFNVSPDDMNFLIKGRAHYVGGIEKRKN